MTTRCSAASPRVVSVYLGLLCGGIVFCEGCRGPEIQNGGAPGESATAADTSDSFIKFHQERIARNPGLWRAYEDLGSAYLTKAGQSGNFSCYRMAEEALRQALELRDDSSRAHKYLASALLSQHRFAEAKAAAQRAAELDPRDAESVGILGDAFLEVGDYETARTHYERMRRLSENPYNLARLSRLEFVTGHTEAAIQTMELAVRLSEELKWSSRSRAWCRVILGALYFEGGKLDNAEEHYRRAAELHPDDPLALEHLAELQAARGAYPEALEIYERLLETRSEAELWVAAADLHTKRGHLRVGAEYRKRAVEEYRRLIRSGSIAHYRHLALLYAEDPEQRSEAVDFARRDLRLRQDVYGYDALAWVYYRNGMLEEAGAAAGAALEYGTEDARLYFHAGMIYHAQGQSEKARELLARALEINPHFQEAGLARETMLALARQGLQAEN